MFSSNNRYACVKSLHGLKTTTKWGFSNISHLFTSQFHNISHQNLNYLTIYTLSFRYMPSVTSGVKVYDSTFRVCVAIPINPYWIIQLNPYFCCFKDLVIGFLLYIASLNDDDLKLFHPEQRDLTRNKYICINLVTFSFSTHMCL